MPKAERCKVNGPSVPNPNEMVRISKTEHVWEWDTFGKRRNPNIRISALYCISHHKYLRPYMAGYLRSRVSANRPKMDQFGGVCQSAHNGPIWKISCTKSKLKGGQFTEKNANSCILGPIFWAVLDILGVCQSAQNCPIYKFWTFSNTKSKFKGGPF